ncbi:MAG: PQQ-binding-like beta-propeller repeat protein [Myxococcales bacterium]|nr:PQQ-binding-like beta-propeller repeat protein [Myxococcales bacterium]
MHRERVLFFHELVRVRAALFTSATLLMVGCVSDDSGGVAVPMMTSPATVPPEAAPPGPPDPAKHVAVPGQSSGVSPGNEPDQPSNSQADGRPPDRGAAPPERESPGGTAAAPAIPGMEPTAPAAEPTPTDEVTPVAPNSGPSEWTMMGYDASNSFVNSNETVLTKDNAASLSELWKADMGGPVYGTPLLVGDTVYATSTAKLAAFDVATGEEKWSATPGTTSSMAYADETLYVHRVGAVFALNASDGSKKWSSPPLPGTPANDSSSPVLVGDHVLVGGSDSVSELTDGTFRGFLAALDRATGDLAWLTHTVPEGAGGAGIWSSASGDAAGYRAYATTGNNYGPPATDTSNAFLAFDLQTGEMLWKSQRLADDTFGGGNFLAGPDLDFGANPVLYEAPIDGVMTQLMAAGSKSGTAHAVRRDTGEQIWERSLGPGNGVGDEGIFSNSAWTGKHLIFAENRLEMTQLYALDGATGEILWMEEHSGLVWGRVSVANGVGFAGIGSKVIVFDVDTGATIKEFSSDGGTVAGAASIANGYVAWGEGFAWIRGKTGRTLHMLSVR